MVLFRLFSGISLFFLIPWVVHAAAHELSFSFIQTARLAQEITVLIRAQQKAEAGFILSSDGTIVTLYHNVINADTISVEFSDGTICEAHLAGGDEQTDVGILKINASRLPSLPLGDSDNTAIGEWVMTAGYPFYRIAVKKGLASGWQQKDRLYLLTDMPFNPGDFGGPLLNLKGEIIGMNYSNTTSQQVFGAAIPSNTIRTVINQFEDDVFFTVLP